MSLTAIMLNTIRSRGNCEIEAKFIQSRIHFVEKNIGEFCNAFSQYSRKAARLRNKGDELAKSVLSYAENESINRSLAVGLEHFAEGLTMLSDYGDLRVQALDSKVVAEFSKYEDICRHVRDEVKEIYSARDREITKKKQLDRIRERSPRNRQQINQAETELVRATTEVSKTIHNLEDRTNEFEAQKLHDIKSILLDFIVTEIGYHAKTLEALTKAYNDVEAINEESDLEVDNSILYTEVENASLLPRAKIAEPRRNVPRSAIARGWNEVFTEEFKKSLQLPETIHHKTSGMSSKFRSSTSLGSLGIFSTHHKKSPGIPNSKDKFSKSEETLDSMKHSFSDSEDDSDDESEENVTASDKSSPIMVKKFLK